MELCLATEIHLGTRVYKPWWYKESLYLEGVRMVAYGRRGRGGGRRGRYGDRDGVLGGRIM